MAKSARRRHANSGDGDAGKSVQNGNHGNKSHRKDEKHVKTEESHGKSSFLKLALVTVTIATCAIIASYYLNQDAKSVIDSSFVKLGIADFLQFSRSDLDVPYEERVVGKQEDSVESDTYSQPDSPSEEPVKDQKTSESHSNKRNADSNKRKPNVKDKTGEEAKTGNGNQEESKQKATVKKDKRVESTTNSQGDTKPKDRTLQDETGKTGQETVHDPKSKKKPYAKSSITNAQDKKIRSELDEADDLREKGQIEKAMDKYTALLKRYPKSPRARYGKAETLDKLAEKRRSNMLLEESIQEFMSVTDLHDCPDDLVIQSGRRAAERMNFRGWSGKAAKTLHRLTQRFPTNIDLKNQLGVAYLMSGKSHEARPVFQSVLDIDPTDGFALVHLGFIYKTTDNDPAKAVPLLRKGVQTRAPGTLDGRFYFHLGDSLQRIGQKEEAYQVYKDGADRGLFRSMFQRSLYNVDHLTGRPWWTPQQTTYQKALKTLEDNWKTIRDEGLAQMDVKSGAFLPEEENLRETGDWKQFTLYQRGQKNVKNCEKAPKTCALIDKIPDAKGCKRGQVKFSVMQPGVHVWPHCGPTNCRIRAHLGLVVPEGPKISVAGTAGKWKEGKFIIFDDSFEHEVWHDGKSFRLVLIVDFWHPELTAHEKANLSPI